MSMKKTRLCTCQRFCQAPPEGRVILIQTWYDHGAQRDLEKKMTQDERDAQKYRIRKTKRPQLQVQSVWCF